jgi:hypothetical protein
LVGFEEFRLTGEVFFKKHTIFIPGTVSTLLQSRL